MVEIISIASGELIVVMDGDKQSDPVDILKMLELQDASDLDLVIGSRFKTDLLLRAYLLIVIF